ENMLMNLYRNIDRSKVQFDFIEHTNEKAAFDDEIIALGGKIFRCPSFKGINYFAYKKWWKDFFESNPQYTLIHGHMGRTAAIYLAQAKKKKIFTIAHSHSTFQKNITEILYKLWSFPIRFIPDCFFACSRESGISRYGKKVGSQCTVLKNAIDTGHFDFNMETRKAMRHELNVEEKTVIGHVGRFFEAKNHSFLLDVFAEIHKKEPKSVLLLVGDGELRSKIENKAKSLGIFDSVIFTSVKADVAPYYQAMDVMCFPSFYEGLPLTTVEAQTAGLACVISDRVPDECILTQGLVDVMSLSDSAGNWADTVLEAAKKTRKSRKQEVTEKGYDIKETAKKLEAFYLENAK
ncbi:MAG: glycosyltransferase, partial [Acutalibacteraceae bacterium]